MKTWCTHPDGFIWIGDTCKWCGHTRATAPKLIEKKRPGKRSVFTAYIGSKPVVSGCDPVEVMKATTT